MLINEVPETLQFSLVYLIAKKLQYVCLGLGWGILPHSILKNIFLKLYVETVTSQPVTCSYSVTEHGCGPAYLESQSKTVMLRIPGKPELFEKIVSKKFEGMNCLVG